MGTGVTVWDSAAVVALIAIALAMLRVDRRVRSGKDRRWLQNYRDPRIPFWIRNGPLLARSVAFSSVMWATGVVVGASIRSLDRERPEAILGALVVLVAFFGGGLYLIASMLRFWVNPRGRKPAWLLEEEETSPLPQASRADDVADLAIALIPVGFSFLIVLGLVVYLVELATGHT